jgi:adenosylhomocysteine nucleosidase
VTAKPETILVVISANAEWAETVAFFQRAVCHSTPYGGFFEKRPNRKRMVFFQGGWGKISAAASTEYAIGRWNPDIVINAGTCGGFRDRIAVGEIVLAEETVVYDIIEQMGDPEEAISFYRARPDLSWLPDPLPLPVRRGRLVSADRDILAQDIPWLIQKFGADAADWESGAIAWVAAKHRLPCLVLRGVTDLVGAGGGEAYGNIELFHQRTHQMMQRLLENLEQWLP